MERLAHIAHAIDASPLADWLALVVILLFCAGLAGLMDGVVNGAVDGVGGLVPAGRNGQ